ncbi:MAG: hypothetical protein JNL67_17580 [Planctomycetaceae bacterium]|nr:hypothetical protein [Planctomycetaceae bacterium]
MHKVPKHIRLFTCWVALLFTASSLNVACGQIQISQFGSSLFILGTAGDENVGILNWSELDTDIEIRNYNGQQVQSLYFSNVENIYIDLLEGNNVVQCPGWAVNVFTTVVGDLEIQTRQGLDWFSLAGITVGGHLVINAGDGNNQFTYGMCHISGDLTITSGSGQDTMNWGLGAEKAGGEIFGNVSIRTGGQIDGVEFRRFTLHGNLYFDAGDGNDSCKLNETTFGNFEFIGGIGDDWFRAEFANSGNSLLLSTGSGVDNIVISDLFVTTRLDVGSGSQADTISLNDVETPGTFKMSTGTHNDSVALSHLNVNNLVVDLSGGNDSLNLTSCQSATSELAGGVGTDSGTKSNCLLGNPATVTGFESGNLN